jgi:hydroxyacylglutathione hydrolase
MGPSGIVFSGNLEAFFESVRRLMRLPGETLVYAGHDYVLASLAFARFLEPENSAIDAFRERYDPHHCRSTIAEEERINPYFRFDEPGILRVLEKRGLPRGTPWERWHSLMSIE